MRRVVQIVCFLGVLVAVLASCGSPAATTTSTQTIATSTPVAATPNLPTSIPATPIPATSIPDAPTAVSTKQDTGALDTAIDIGGRHLYILCAGAGSPTVVLDSGLGGDSRDWSSVMPLVRSTTRVCAYDRAGLGGSDPASKPPKPRTSKDMAQDLHTLLAKASIPGPYVLVGWSIAGFNVRMYASEYPADVVGMVFVDAAHPDQEERALAALPPPSLNDGGELRDLRSSLSTFIHDPYQNDEWMDIAASEAQVRATGSFGSIPLVVLTRGLSETSPGLPKDIAAKQDQVWMDLQNELASLSTNSTHLVADMSHHCIPCDQPDVVAKAIEKVVTVVRSK